MKKQNRIIAVICAVSAAAALCSESVSAMLSSSYRDTGNVEISINTIDIAGRISPYIYGINAESDISGVTVNAVKQSDMRISSYNWETNYSNSGSGNGSENSLALVESYPGEDQQTPALYTDNLMSRAKRYGIPSKYVTLQMMGKVAPSGSGSPWENVVFSKNDSYLTAPDTSDGTVYMDEYVSFLANRYGYAVDGGINGYFLDCEPENWFTRFPEATPERIAAEPLISRSAELADAVKRIDPTALVYGPSISGIDAFINIKNPADWEKYRNDYSWFIDYYLDKMKAASYKSGKRLLDVLDIHYHTEATNGLLLPIIDSNDALSNNVRMQAPRILWDSSYTENSTTAIMHSQYIPLIPTLNASIDMYYPGTKLSFSEYNFGGGDNVSGGIAAADALGIFAEYGVHMACMRPNTSDISYMKSAINIYTNYDGNGSRFGNTLVGSANGGDIMSSVYAAVTGRDETSLKTVLINKNQNSPKTAEIKITSSAVFESAEVYSFDGGSSEITRRDDISDIENNSFSFEMEPLSVYMLVFDGRVNEDVLKEDTDIPDSEQTDVISSESTVSDTETTETTPEHVEASTYSSAGTSVPAEEEPEDTLLSETVTSLQDPADEEVIGTSTAVSAAEADENDPEERSVPKAVKVIVSVLVAAVVLAFIYVIISDRITSIKDKK